MGEERCSSTRCVHILFVFFISPAALITCCSWYTECLRTDTTSRNHKTTWGKSKKKKSKILSILKYQIFVDVMQFWDKIKFKCINNFHFIVTTLFDCSPRSVLVRSGEITVVNAKRYRRRSDRIGDAKFWFTPICPAATPRFVREADTRDRNARGVLPSEFHVESFASAAATRYRSPFFKTASKARTRDRSKLRPWAPFCPKSLKSPWLSIPAV